MLSRDDIVPGMYLRQRGGECEGLMAVVHKVGTSWSGEWFFQLRYLSRPAGTRKRPTAQWSLNLGEKDLAHFERVGTWIPADVFQTAGPPSAKPRKEPRLPVWMRGKDHPDQLRLFDDE